MKQKALKINQTTLFVYKQSKLINGKFETDTTTMLTTTQTTTGIFKR